MLAYLRRVMKQFSVLLTLTGLVLCSCERHAWHTDPEKEPESTDTINLFLHDEDHSKDHGKDGEGEKKDQ